MAQVLVGCFLFAPQRARFASCWRYLATIPKREELARGLIEFVPTRSTAMTVGDHAQ